MAGDRCLRVRRGQPVRVRALALSMGAGLLLLGVANVYIEVTQGTPRPLVIKESADLPGLIHESMASIRRRYVIYSHLGEHAEGGQLALHPDSQLEEDAAVAIARVAEVVTEEYDHLLDGEEAERLRALPHVEDGLRPPAETFVFVLPLAPDRAARFRAFEHDDTVFVVDEHTLQEAGITWGSGP
jgi:hypothetical protein